MGGLLFELRKDALSRSRYNLLETSKNVWRWKWARVGRDLNGVHSVHYGIITFTRYALKTCNSILIVLPLSTGHLTLARSIAPAKSAPTTNQSLAIAD